MRCGVETEASHLRKRNAVRTKFAKAVRRVVRFQKVGSFFLVDG
jgi:hypothetical protein